MAATQRAALQLPPRRAAQQRAKIPTISRAEGGQLQAPVGRLPDLGAVCGLLIDYSACPPETLMT